MILESHVSISNDEINGLLLKQRSLWYFRWPKKKQRKMTKFVKTNDNSKRTACLTFNAAEDLFSSPPLFLRRRLSRLKQQVEEHVFFFAKQLNMNTAEQQAFKVFLSVWWWRSHTKNLEKTNCCLNFGHGVCKKEGLFLASQFLWNLKSLNLNHVSHPNRNCSDNDNLRLWGHILLEKRDQAAFSHT